MARSKIEWLARPGTIPESWNPVTGCDKVSEGCIHCYAERMARRLAGRFGYPDVPNHFDVTLRPDRLDAPLRWKKPRTVFVCSMGDLFHEDVPSRFIAQVFDMMAQASSHIFLVLTKRPATMLSWLLGYYSVLYDFQGEFPLPNVWLGITVENQRAADERRSDFEQVAAAVKFVSYEPALGPVDWTGWEFVDQIISGGESGPGARPSHPDWHRATRDFCQENGISYFMKQWGAWAEPHAASFRLKRDLLDDIFDGKFERMILEPVQLPGGWATVFKVGKHRAGRLLDGREWNEWPR
jgi:protein gp37